MPRRKQQTKTKCSITSSSQHLLKGYRTTSCQDFLQWKSLKKSYSGQNTWLRRSWEFESFHQHSTFPSCRTKTTLSLWQLCSDDQFLLDLLDQKLLQENQGGTKVRVVVWQEIVDDIRLPIRATLWYQSAVGLAHMSMLLNCTLQVAGELSINATLVEAGTKQVTIFL